MRHAGTPGVRKTRMVRAGPRQDGLTDSAHRKVSKENGMKMAGTNGSF